ncbi:outer membrane protein assembly factor BamE [Pseudomaricurvus sp.]|uniref:outer membrane protein assembly factor BamE n=1 Tax=Pseudomaricurvus sp. TaxID=2004510 RepID=UPI003F6BE6B8
MQKHVRRLFLATSLLLLAGCQYFQFPGVYKIDIQQGNIVTQEMIDQLKPGMTKRQVRYVMGTPLIEDTFNPNRWDYYYSMAPGKGELVKERVSIYFEGDSLSYFSGDYSPSAATSNAATSETTDTSTEASE